MEIERQYLSALQLTHQMWAAAENQEWATLTALERQRAAMIASIPPIARITPALDSSVAQRIAGIITEMERENADILEQAQVWQEHARILLRLDKPVVV
jgi:hypothetical protein